MNQPTGESARVVHEFFDAMQARDWERARELIANDARIRFSETGEVFKGTNFVSFNQAYPELWTIHVVEVIDHNERVAVQVRVDFEPLNNGSSGGDSSDDGSNSTGGDVEQVTTFWCAGFYSVSQGQIVDGVEHWVTANSMAPPEWRAHLVEAERFEP